MAWTLSWVDLTLILSFILVVLYHFGTNTYTFFQKNNIRTLATIPFAGNMFRMVTGEIHFSNVVQAAYNKFENEKYFGIYFFKFPQLVIRDLDLVKRITIKDFDHFTDHFQLIAKEDTLLYNNLFFMKGERWHQMRTTLSPAFTASKMRAMMPFIVECAKRLVEQLKVESKASQAKTEKYLEKEAKNMLSKITNDVIASCAFGIETDSSKDPDNDFYKMTKILLNIRLQDTLVLVMVKIIPFIRKIFNWQITGERTTNFYRYIVMDIIKSRTKSGVVRKDMIHLLMLAMKGSLTDDSTETKEEDIGFAITNSNNNRATDGTESKVKREVKINWTDDEITAQAVIFLMAGFDTVSSVLSFMCYELVRNQEAQARLREEVDQYIASNGDTIKYDDIRNLTYMDMVLTETLRLWPPVGNVDRICIKPFKLPPTPSSNAEYTIRPGDIVQIPAYSIHRDPKYYTNPDAFIPERFSEENKESINPLTYLPFGIGPRSCIGNRFALMKAKVIMFYLIANFELIRTPRTEIPVKILGHPFLLKSRNGIWMGLKERNV